MFKSWSWAVHRKKLLLEFSCFSTSKNQRRNFSLAQVLKTFFQSTIYYVKCFSLIARLFGWEVYCTVYTIMLVVLIATNRRNPDETIGRIVDYTVYIHVLQYPHNTLITPPPPTPWEQAYTQYRLLLYLSAL